MKKHERKKSKLMLFIIIAFLGYFTYTIIDQQNIFNVKSIEMKVLESKIREEKKTGEELKKQEEMFNSDEYIEKIAREKLGMVKKGEKVFIDTNK